MVHSNKLVLGEITYCSDSPANNIFAIEVGLKSVCNHLFTKAVDQPSKSASKKTKISFSQNVYFKINIRI